MATSSSNSTPNEPLNTGAKTFSAEDYFHTQPPPPNLDVDVHKVREFVAVHGAAGKRVVLVTVRILSSRDRFDLITSIERWNYCSFRAQCVSLLFMKNVPKGLYVPQRSFP